MRYFFLCITILVSLPVVAQDLTGQELLEKAISYHDPQGAWHSFNDKFKVTMSTPDEKNGSVIL